MLRRRVPALAHVGRVGSDAGVHLVLNVRVALNETGALAFTDPEQVVEDEHLAVGRRARADPYHRNLRSTASAPPRPRRDRLEHDREAAGLLQRQRLPAIRVAASCVRPWARYPPSAVEVCGVRPM